MEENANPVKVQFGHCCFCGENIVITEIDPCRITVETVKEKWQVWFCHAKCFKERLFSNPEIDLSPAHF